jgi:amino acid adenylation domain-containing protein
MDLFTNFPQDKTLVDLFEEQVLRTPDNIAVEFEEEEMSYRELDCRANQLANYLISLGVVEDSLVPICLTRSLDMIIAALGVLKAGGAYVPIDPEYPIDRIEYTLSDTNGAVVIAESGGPLTQRVCKSPLLLLDLHWKTIREESEKSPATQPEPHHLAYVIYTSGSTGRPKGVMIEHRNVVRLFFNDAPLFRFGEQDVWTMFHSFCFDFSVWEMYGALLFGGKVIVVPKQITKESTLYADLLLKKNVTILNQTPSAFYVLQDYILSSEKESNLRYVIFGGEALNPAKLMEWKLRYPQTMLINMYGITETTVHVTYQEIELEHCKSSKSIIGSPIPTLYAYVLDNQLQKVPAGTAGELYIGGAGLARGYLNMAELTAERFITDPFQSRADGRLYRTGDLAKINADGSLEYLGRIDDQVKIRGFRIELGEIENTLQTHPQVKQAVVLAKDDGAGNKRLIGYIVPASEYQRSDVISFLETRLPEYMVPRLIMELNEIPLTSNGKADKKKLPNPEASDLINTLYVAPGNSLEETIVAIWKKLLHLEKIGVCDNFFELGGNSLLAQQTVSLLLAENIQLAITKLYQHPTARGIASFIQSRTTSGQKKKNKKKSPGRHVAVIAMAGRFPGANTVEKLWENLKEGRESIRFFSPEELDPSISQSLTTSSHYVRARGIIDGAEEFDYHFFGINKKIAEAMDPQQRKFLEICWEALESAGHLSEASKDSMGVYAGSSSNTYFINNVHTSTEVRERIGDFNILTLNDKDFLASRVAYALNIKGPAVTVQSACSTSLLAIAEAAESIRSGRCRTALAGGVSITCPINSGHIYEEGAILSDDGHCRTFDAGAKGTVFSDGAAVVLLKDFEEAKKDGDHIYAVVEGIGVNNDGGFKGSFTAPSAEGQASCITIALEDAQVDPSTITYVEAHGTATPIGDPIEIEGLTMAFGPQAIQQYCAIGSIKSNFGHLTQAAGVAGFIKTCLALYHGQIPPSINFEKPNKDLQLESSPFYVNQKLSTWKVEGKKRAGVSSFGVGGTNVHVILSEFLREKAPGSKGRPVELITWSSKSESSCENYGSRLKDYVTRNPEKTIADLAYTMQVGRQEFNHRRFVLATDREELINILGNVPNSSGSNSLKSLPDQLAFIFPGQGAQYLNMGFELYIEEPVFRKAIDECAELLQNEIGEDIREVIYNKTNNSLAEQRLNNTFYTQPSLFITEYALARLWMSWGIEPDILIGHSIGEFVAAHLAGVFSLKDAIYLIASRAKMMVGLPGGSMLAVRISHATLEAYLNDDFSVAAVNAPNTTVIAGSTSHVMALASRLEQDGIVSKLLQTSHAFHSYMMDPIVEPFRLLVESIKLNVPRKPIISTLTGDWMKDAEALDPSYWARHLRATVMFASAVKTMADQNLNIVALECGPRSGSTVLIKQQVRTGRLTAIPSLEFTAAYPEYHSIMKAVGQLWINGFSVSWDTFNNNRDRLKLHDAPNYAFEKNRCWIEPGRTEITSERISETNHQPIYKPDTEGMRKNSLIEKLKEIVEDTSGIETEGIDPTASFLEIGLDSLLLTQLALTLKKQFQLPITFRKLSEEYGSIGLLATYLDANLPQEKTAAASVKPNSTGGPTEIEMISQQIQLLAQQVAKMQQQPSIGNAASPIAPKLDLTDASDITAEEMAELKKPFGATARIERQITALNGKQKAWIDDLIRRYNEKTQKSKQYTQKHRACMADPRVVSGFRPATKEIVYQIVVEKSKGSYLWDIDGNKYIDMLNGFGSNMLGYQPDFIKQALLEQIEKGYEIGPQHVLAGEVSQLICDFTGHERAALCNTGSEAVLVNSGVRHGRKPGYHKRKSG